MPVRLQRRGLGGPAAGDERVAAGAPRRRPRAGPARTPRRAKPSTPTPQGRSPSSSGSRPAGRGSARRRARASARNGSAAAAGDRGGERGLVADRGSSGPARSGSRVPVRGSRARRRPGRWRARRRRPPGRCRPHAAYDVGDDPSGGRRTRPGRRPGRRGGTGCAGRRRRPGSELGRVLGQFRHARTAPAQHAHAVVQHGLRAVEPGEGLGDLQRQAGLVQQGELGVEHDALPRRRPPRRPRCGVRCRRRPRPAVRARRSASTCWSSTKVLSSPARPPLSVPRTMRPWAPASAARSASSRSVTSASTRRPGNSPAVRAGSASRTVSTTSGSSSEVTVQPGRMRTPMGRFDQRRARSRFSATARSSPAGSSRTPRAPAALAAGGQSW